MVESCVRMTPVLAGDRQSAAYHSGYGGPMHTPRCFMRRRIRTDFLFPAEICVPILPSHRQHELTTIGRRGVFQHRQHTA